MSLSFIPYGAYWSTPFAKWQGSLSHLHSLQLAAHVAKQALAAREIPLSALDYGVLGTTVPQIHGFYGLPWVSALMGADHVTGPTISQACATSARTLQVASAEIQSGSARCALVINGDRCSNGPHVFYPSPNSPGGTGQSENWVMDNFGCDPNGHHSMLDTAENVATRFHIGTAEQHEVVLMRYQQYQQALADDRAFQKRYMPASFAIPDAQFRKSVGELAGDEGIFATNAAGLARLRPLKSQGTVTFGGQTHPADGAAGMLVTTEAQARELSRNSRISIALLAFGQARTERGYMPQAPVPASRRALEAAGLRITDIDAVKSHNPFAVNDIVFSRETGFPLQKMNQYGCSLIWGHPQGPTGLRAVIELIEELVVRGGGTGLFQGCAAGDSAMAVIIRVTEASG
jgi:acetyl-CoA acetyltransferase